MSGPTCPLCGAPILSNTVGDWARHVRWSVNHGPKPIRSTSTDPVKEADRG